MRTKIIPNMNSIHAVNLAVPTIFISLYSVRMRENTDQNNSECGHFSRKEPASAYNPRRNIWDNFSFHFITLREKFNFYF